MCDARIQVADPDVRHALVGLKACIDRLERRQAALLAVWNALAITNVTPDTAYDADATTVAELGDVLGTLQVDIVAALNTL